MPGTDDRTADIRAVFIVFIPLVCLFTTLRCYVRGWVVKAFGWDDGLMILAFVLYITGCALVITGTYNGFGHKLTDLSTQQGATAMKYSWLYQVFYVVSTGVCKISVCVFLIRITVRPLHLRLLYAMLVFISIHSIVYLITYFTICHPFVYFWSQLLPGAKGSCLDIVPKKAIINTTAAALCLIDIVMGIAIPFLVVHKLQMPKVTKFSVMGIMGLGCLATVALLLRFPYLITYADGDPLYTSVDIIIWAYVEVSLNIFAGNLATLGPLLRTWFRVHADTDTTPTPGQRQQQQQQQQQQQRGRPCGVWDFSFPLSTLDETVGSRFRPDKPCVMVTQVRSQRRSEAYDANKSQEELTAERRSTSAGSGGELGQGIYRTTEVMQTSDVESVVAGECV